MVDGLEKDYAGRVDFVVYKDAGSTEQVYDFATRQGVGAVPTMMLVGADGTELARWEGSRPKADLAGAFDAAL